MLTRWQKIIATHPIQPKTIADTMARLYEELEELEDAIDKQKRFPICSIQESIDGELADVFYFLLQLANHYHINLEEAFLKKMTYNTTRYRSK